MNKETEELYRELQQDPFGKRTFTSAKMDAIELLAGERGTGSKQQRKRSVGKSIWAVSAASIAVVILVILLIQHPWKDKDIEDGGGKTAKPPVTTPEPAPADIPVKPALLTGELREQLPFDTEKIESITLLPAQGMEVNIAQDRAHVIPQNLYRENLTLAKADVQVSGEQDVMIRIHMADGIYAIPYNVDSNTFELGGERFYADDQVMLLMHGLFRPESSLAFVDRMMAQADKEMNESENKIDESFVYKRERFDIGGKDYNAWADAVGKDTSYSYSKPYYDGLTESMASIREYEKNGLLVLQSNLVFMKDTVKTADGIKVGMTKEQVLALLGKANLELSSRWSYKLGDYLKFHLYFDNDQMVFLSLTMP